MLSAGQTLRVYLPRPATIHWQTKDSDTVRQTKTSSAGLDLQLADIDTSHLMPNQSIHFKIQYAGGVQAQAGYTIIVKEE
jgi:hypothetical protein